MRGPETHTQARTHTNTLHAPWKTFCPKRETNTASIWSISLFILFIFVLWWGSDLSDTVTWPLTEAVRGTMGSNRTPSHSLWMSEGQSARAKAESLLSTLWDINTSVMFLWRRREPCRVHRPCSLTRHWMATVGRALEIDPINAMTQSSSALTFKQSLFCLLYGSVKQHVPENCKPY